MDASFWFFRRYFATAFLLDSPAFAVTVFARVVLRGLLGSFFPAEPFTGLSPRGEGARAFPLNWKALPTSKTCCVCAHARISARYSAFRSIRLSGPRLGSLQEFQGCCCVVKGSTPSPSLLCPGARDFLRLLVPVPLFCGFSCLGVVAALFRLPCLSCMDDAEARMLLKQLGLLLDSSLFRIFGLCCAGAQAETWRNVVEKLAPWYYCSRASGLVRLGLAGLSR